MAKLIPKHQKEKSMIGTTVTNHYGDKTHYLPIYKDDNGNVNIGLPDIVVTPRNNLNLASAVNEGRNRIGKLGVEVLSMATPVGDVQSVYEIGKDVKSGNYGQAALGAGLMLLPNVVEKPLKRIGKLLKKNKKIVNELQLDNVKNWVALNPVFKGLGRVAEYGLAKAGNKWARAKVLSRNLDNSPKNIDKATQAFRNSEWSNFLSTRNGNNYYRMAKSSKLPNTNIEGEKLFISHTTPWEEFSGLGTSEPIGTKVLYEFPTKTFGVRKATNYRGIPGEIDVTQMGRSHLNFGNTSSGFRGKVQLLPEQQAETIGMEPYTIGINSRPLNKRGFYDTRPDYEDIYQGNQTAVTSQELRDALLNSKYNQFEYSPSGITKKLYNPLKQKKRLIMDDKTVPAYFGKKYSVNDVVNRIIYKVISQSTLNIQI